MTREEVISELNYLKEYYNDKDVDVHQRFDDEDNEALDMAIEALEQELCEDYISRQAMLEIQVKYAGHMGATWYWQLRDEIKSLPSVTPQQKTGQWIYEVGNRETGYGGCTMCSECSGEGNTEMDYCPHCGAKMESEVQE